MIIATLRSLRWADFFLHTLLDPPALVRAIKRNDPRYLALSFSVPVLLAFTHIIVQGLMGQATPFFYYRLTYGWILCIIMIVATSAVYAAMADCSAQLFSLHGRVREVIALVNFSLFPQVFLLPLISTVRILRFAPVFFFFLFSMMLVMWTWYILVRSFMELHNITAARAILVLVVPLALVAVTVFFVLLLVLILAWGFVVS